MLSASVYQGTVEPIQSFAYPAHPAYSISVMSQISHLNIYKNLMALL